MTTSPAMTWCHGQRNAAPLAKLTWLSSTDLFRSKLNTNTASTFFFEVQRLEKSAKTRQKQYIPFDI